MEGFEPPTRCLQNSRSTPELHPRCWSWRLESNQGERVHNPPPKPLGYTRIVSSRKASANPAAPWPRRRTSSRTAVSRPAAAERSSFRSWSLREDSHLPALSDTSLSCWRVYCFATQGQFGPPHRTRTCPPQGHRYLKPARLLAPPEGESLVPARGFEPPRPSGHCVLSAARLPWLRHAGMVGPVGLAPTTGSRGRLSIKSRGPSLLGSRTHVMEGVVGLAPTMHLRDRIKSPGPSLLGSHTHMVYMRSPSITVIGAALRCRTRPSSVRKRSPTTRRRR